MSDLSAFLRAAVPEALSKLSDDVGHSIRTSLSSSFNDIKDSEIDAMIDHVATTLHVALPVYSYMILFEIFSKLADTMKSKIFPADGIENTNA